MARESRARCTCPARDHEAAPLVNGDRDELICGPPARPGWPWLGLDRQLYIDIKTEPNRGDPMSVATENSAGAAAIRPFKFEALRRNSRRCVRVSRPHASPIRRPSKISRRARSWRRSGRSRATGRRSTTGASARRSSTPYRSSSPRSTGWTSTSFMFVRSTKMRCRSSSRTDGPAQSSSR